MTTVSLKNAPAAPKSSGAKDAFVGMLESFGATNFGAEPAWLKQSRAQALGRARSLGFPTTRDEEWRFTNIAPLLNLPLHMLDAPERGVALEEIKPFTFDLDGPRLVFVDGHFVSELSVVKKIAGLEYGNILSFLNGKSSELEKHLGRYADTNSNLFAALNGAFFRDGAFICASAKQKIDQPIHLLYVSTGGEGSTAHPRNLIIAQPQSEVQVLETYVSLAESAQVTNAVTEMVVGEEAHLEHCRIQNENERAFHIATVQAHQERASQWLSHSIAIGARLARNQVNTVLNASGAVGTLNGLYLTHGEQLVDHHTIVDHAKPHCESHEYYHGILADKSRAVFNGKIFVRKDAQKTNAKQTNRNLVLSDNAMIDTKPQLEIFADDVKCTHGATVGQLSDEALFYLRARGIGYENARRILIRAFASDVIERIQLETVRAKLEELLAERFAV